MEDMNAKTAALVLAFAITVMVIVGAITPHHRNSTFSPQTEAGWQEFNKAHNPEQGGNGFGIGDERHWAVDSNGTF